MCLPGANRRSGHRSSGSCECAFSRMTSVPNDAQHLYRSINRGLPMRQLVYGMQFTGRAQPVEGSSGVMRASTSAPSCTITSLVGPDGLAAIVNPAAGGTAGFESEVSFTGEESFLESGRIS